MAKWYGKVGFITQVESEPGIWTSQLEERPYYGDVLTNTARWSQTSKVNDDLTVSNRISIVSDPFAVQTFHAIKYVEFMGSMWEVTNVEVQYPRLVMTVGGVYNGERAQA